MALRWILASLHLLALGIGLAAVWARGHALRGELDRSRVGRVLLADTFWGIAALLWISTGVWRAFGGVEKGTDYYLSSTPFLIKMALLLAILVLEIRPMTTFIRWRTSLGKGEPVSTGSAMALGTISYVQVVLVVLMVFAATAMARGLW